MHCSLNYLCANLLMNEWMKPKRSEWALNSPTRSVGEHNVALFSRPLSEGYTSVFLPVTHRLTENRSLTAWKELTVLQLQHVETTQTPPRKKIWTIERSYRWNSRWWRKGWCRPSTLARAWRWPLSSNDGDSVCLPLSCSGRSHGKRNRSLWRDIHIYTQ